MSRIYALALNTFREAIRNKVVHGICFVVVGANLFALVLGQMSLHEEARVALDVGLGAISLFGAATAIFLGVSLLYGEVQKKTIHTILSKPIERHEFVLGKYLGMAATLLLLVAVFAAVLAALLLIARVSAADSRIGWDDAVTKAVLLSACEVLVVAATAVFFSAFSSPFLSGIFTFALFVLGRVTEDMRLAAEQSHSEVVKTLATLGSKIVPDLHLYAVSGTMALGKPVSVHGEFVSWSYVGQSTLHACAWIAFLLVSASLVFRQRDFA